MGRPKVAQFDTTVPGSTQAFSTQNPTQNASVNIAIIKHSRTSLLKILLQYYLNIVLDAMFGAMVPSDPFMSHLATRIGYSAGEFQALQLIVLATCVVVD